METPVRSNIPSEFCKSTQEALLAKKKNPLEIDDDCPICARRGTLCEVGCHPSTASSAVAPKSAPSAAPRVYRATGQCERSLQHKGFRAGAYLCCAEHCGFFDRNEADSFKYNEAGDLQISLIFKSEKDGRRFTNKMIEHCRFFKVPFQHQLSEVPHPDSELTPVYWDDYKRIQSANDAEVSPEYTIAASSSSVSEYPEMSSIEDPNTVLMMIERSDLREFVASAPYQCHLIGKRNKTYATDTNNILHLSWTMHDWLDGLNRKRRRKGEKRIPSIKVVATGREEVERVRLRDGSEVDTTRVYIRISSANTVLLDDLQGMLKEGSHRDSVDDRSWITFVNVFDLAKFKHCLATKAAETQKLWDENGGCPVGF